MAIALRYAARSDIGLGRYRNNQDSAYAGPHLLVVADGMGGHAGGDVASSMAVGELAPLDGDAHGGDDALQHLEEAIHAAHARMHQRVEDDPDLAGMGTTVTALLRAGNRFALAHIGDSRAYLLSGDRFTQVTRDHTFVQWLIDEGRITPEQAEVHPQRSVVMRVLGDVDANDELDTSVREAVAGDRWLLCSDGLSGFVSDETLEATLREVAEPGECADRLVALALRAGGQDNITCIVADVVDAASAPPSTPQVVGAAAAGPHRRSAGADSPASRAAALGQPPADEEGDEDDAPGHDVRRGRGWVRAVVALVLGAVLVGGGYAGYAWSQTQFFVGTSEDDEVVIFRGLSQDVGPFSLSTVEEAQDLPVDTLPVVWQARVEAGIPADDLDHAREIARTLLQRSQLCQVAEPQPGTTGEGTDGAGEGTDGTAPVDGSGTTDGTGTAAPEDEGDAGAMNVFGDPLPAGCAP